MKNLPVSLVACVICLLGAVAVAQDRDREGDFERRGRFSQRQRDGNDAFSAQYAVVVENNIFLRDRRQRMVLTTAPATQAVQQSDPLKDLVLVGVVFEEGEFRAYFENLKGGGITRAVVGDPIANGLLGEVFIDAVGFATDEGQKWIEIGQDLTGEYAAIPSVQRPVIAGSTSPAQSGQGGGANSTANMSIEDRLRQRRLQEAGAARPDAVRGAPQPTVVPLPGELPPDAVFQGEMVITRQSAGGTEVDVLVVPQRIPPPTDQPQRQPD